MWNDFDGFPTGFNHFPERLGSEENRLNDDISSG